MIADDATPAPAADDDRRLGGSGPVAPYSAGPLHPRRTNFDQIERALHLVADQAAHELGSPVKAEAELLMAMTPVILDAIYAAHYYRTRGHYEVVDFDFLGIGAWIAKDVIAAADNVVRWVAL